jgi:uncharacterized membrane-anchored protein YhcB (DUF1043 family)
MNTADSAAKKQENLQTELSSLKHQVECKTKEIVKITHELENAQSRQLADLQIFENVLKKMSNKLPIYLTTSQIVGCDTASQPFLRIVPKK